MKILHVLHSIDPATGGTSEGARTLVQAQLDAGHHTSVVSLDAPTLTHSMPGTVHLLGPTSGTYGRTPALPNWLTSHVGEFAVVIVHGLWQYPGFATRRACLRAGVPYVVFPHGMLDPWFKRTYPLKHVKKWLYWPWGEFRILRDAARVLFTAEEERRAARESFWLYRAHEQVVGFGTATPPTDADAQLSAFREAFPQLANRRLLLYLGRIHPKKGCDLLMQAFAAAGGDLHLVMAGPDPDGLRPQLEKLAGSAAERITWTGMLKGHLKWGAIRAAEAFILPSHQENFGVAVVEALACGVPVLISNRVNIWREIAQDGCGLVAADDLDGCTRLITGWLTLTAEQRQRLRAATLPSFERRFAMAGMAARLDQALSSVIATNEHSPRLASSHA